MSRFVKPERTRLHLADVHKRAHAELIKKKDATPDEIAESAARVAYAESLGDWIDVKRRLNTGESQELFARMSPHLVYGEKTQFNTRIVVTAKVVAYLLGWSLKDDDTGQPVPMSPDMAADDKLAIIGNLDTDTFREIDSAIDWHEEAVQKEIDASKKLTAGMLTPAAT